MNSDDYNVKYLHLFIRWKYFCFESSEAWRQEAKLWHFSMIYIYEPEWESKLSKTVWFWLVSPQKARACITATLCYYNALSAEWSCALCSGTLIRRNVPPAHSQHFRVAVDVEKYIRYIDKSLASELKHFLLPQSSGRRPRVDWRRSSYFHNFLINFTRDTAAAYSLDIFSLFTACCQLGPGARSARW